VWLKVAQRQVRVQAGMRWRDLQTLIDPHDLAVKTMQSYANFTVGGAVSVNAHGRYVGNGPVGHSVRALQLVLADGQVLEANRQQNASLFRAALGGYGAVGVITEVELDLVPNERMERVVKAVRLEDYPAFFRDEVLADGRSVMHNADLMPPHFDAPVSVTWRRTELPPTEPARLVPEGQSCLEPSACARRWSIPCSIGGRLWCGATTRPAWMWPSWSRAPAACPPMCCRSTSYRPGISCPLRAAWPRC